MVRWSMLVAGLAGVIALSGCTSEQQMATGVAALDELCPQYRDIVDRVPLAIDEGPDGTAPPAADAAIAELRTETAQLRAEVEPLGQSHTREAFTQFVQETASALSAAEQDMQRTETGRGWESVQRNLNETLDGADERLREAMADAGVRLREEC